MSLLTLRLKQCCVTFPTLQTDSHLSVTAVFWETKKMSNARAKLKELGVLCCCAQTEQISLQFCTVFIHCLSISSLKLYKLCGIFCLGHSV
ncbi:hypothetical protein Nmel_010246 [Mimus melanotis]